MPSTATPATGIDTSAHGELACADTEALLADVTAENTRLREQIADLTRRLDNATAQKNIAIDEAVMLRSRPEQN